MAQRSPFDKLRESAWDRLTDLDWPHAYGLRKLPHPALTLSLSKGVGGIGASAVTA